MSVKNRDYSPVSGLPPVSDREVRRLAGRVRTEGETGIVHRSRGADSESKGIASSHTERRIPYQPGHEGRWRRADRSLAQIPSNGYE